MRRWVLMVIAAGCEPGANTPDDSDEPDTDPVVDPDVQCTPPQAALSRGGDASSDAAGLGQLYEEVRVPEITDVARATSGAAWVDVDGDGDLDVYLSRERGLDLRIQTDCWTFRDRETTVGDDLGEGLSAPIVADFDGDGLRDVYVTSAGEAWSSRLFRAVGDAGALRDITLEAGVGNEGAYVRGHALVGDIDDDGWLDLVVGAHQIGGQVELGRPLQRIYRQTAPGGLFGGFEDLAGTGAVPGFGGADRSFCDPGHEWTGLGVALADLDDDGDLDLLHAGHIDMLSTKADDACATGENPYGLRAWRNEGGSFRAMSAEEGWPVSVGRMQWDEPSQTYVVSDNADAIGPETLTLVDVDNDGDRDLLAVGPTDPDWHVGAAMASADGPGRVARFWRRDADGWTEATAEVGLDVLDSTLDAWARVWSAKLPKSSPLMDEVCRRGPNPEQCEDLLPGDRNPYPGQVLVLDADNDGWQDLLFVVRQCTFLRGSEDSVRSVLLRNTGGAFEVVPTEVSGVTGCGLAAFAPDIDGDGLRDLHLLTREALQTSGRLTDRIFRNTGVALDAQANHWLVVDLEGPLARTLDARVVARVEGEVVATGWFTPHAWRGSVEPWVHLGLGPHEVVDVEVHLRDGTMLEVSVDADQRVRLSP